jgi:hypothetical protein
VEGRLRVRGGGGWTFFFGFFDFLFFGNAVGSEREVGREAGLFCKICTEVDKISARRR